MQCAVRATALHACKHLVQPGWLDGRIPLVHTWVMCRAKLEDALERLQRIMSAMAADAAQAPPNTVERAARGPGHAGGGGRSRRGGGGGGGGGHALAQAGGRAVVREDCHAAAHGQQPAPGPLPEALTGLAGACTMRTGREPAADFR